MKRSMGFRVILILIFLVTAVYYLIPTVRLQTMGEDQKERLRLRGELSGIQKQAIKRGLDLQGGMHLVLEVDLLELFNNLARNKDLQFNRMMETLQGLNLETEEEIYTAILAVAREHNVTLNRYFGITERGDESVITFLRENAEKAVDQALQILRNRIDQFGVAEPSIQKIGDKRIIVELPGIQNIEGARNLIGRTALLEFKLLKDPETTTETLERIDDYMKRNRLLAAGGDTTALANEKGSQDTTRGAAEDSTVSLAELFRGETERDSDAADIPGDSMSVDENMFEENPFFSLFRDLRPYNREIGVPEKNMNAVNYILARPEVKRLIPPDGEFVWSNEPDLIDGVNYYELYFLKREPELTGSVITEADVSIGGGYSPTAAGQPVVNMGMNSEGARVWSRVTGANIGKKIAVVLDNRVFSSPVVRSKIPTGNSVIEGIGDMDEAKRLAIVLRSGALPAPVEIIEERTVGPSLGADSIRKGTQSALYGMGLVVIFMVVYYNAAGLVANLALLLNIIFIMAVMAGFHATLTLPGIAGIVLTIGMAVDANVLIFERIREELRTGKTVRAAIDSGYGRAFSAILDANITTLLTALVLYQYGTGPIRGFALTLSIGLITSMFTAIVVTRVVFDFVTSRWNIKKLSI